MPLSDHEQRLLEQMERALYAEDPKFADSLRKTRRASMDRKRIAFGIAGALAGLALLLFGAASQLEPVGVIGFLIMLAGAVVAYRAFVATPAAQAGAPVPEPGTATPRGTKPAAPKHKQRARSSGGFMERLEERWRKRREDRGQF